MNPTPHNDDAPSREEQAGEWCVRLSTGSLMPDEQAAFDRWMAGDPANAATLDRALGVWHGLQAIGDTPEIIGQRADALDALRRANQRRWSRRLNMRWPWAVGIAAVLVVALVSSLWLMSGPDIYRTGVGERRTVLLADGSRLSLDAETRVEVDYAGDRRRLTLVAGRAKFDVAKDAARPFTVTAGDRTVIATGTAFSVELLGRQLHLIVYEGKVAFIAGRMPAVTELLAIKANPAGRATPVTPGNELIADLTLPEAPQLVQADVARSLAWEGGQLNFVDEPLASAVARINRYSGTKIVIGDGATADIQVNGVFNAGDSAAFVEAVADAYGLRARHEGDEIRLGTP